MGASVLKKRYFAKLSANLTGVSVGLISQAAIMRGLGPRTYGDFGFLSNFFGQITGLFDMGTSTGFYTKLSQRQSEFGLISFYLGLYAGFASTMLLVFLAAIHLTGLYQIVLPGQGLFFIYLAAIWAILNFGIEILNKMADAYGMTVSTEIARMVQRALGLAVIVVLFLLSRLSLTTLFLYHYSLFAFIGVAIVYILGRGGHSLRRSWRLTIPRIKAYSKEFYVYCHPLVIASAVASIVGILDRWMLQEFGGSAQQGYFTFAYKIGAVYFMVSSAMIPLVMREFAIAFSNSDLTKMAALFRRHVPLFYSITAYIACFGVVEADNVALFMGGGQYFRAIVPVVIMSIFPVYQVLWQFNASVFYATGRTRLYRNIGIINNIVGLLVSYILMAPSNRLGMGFGATGLAIKMVVFTIIAVNVRFYFNARLLNLDFLRYVIHQVLVVVCFLSIAAVSRLAMDRGLGLSERVVTSFILAGTFYTGVVMILVFFCPSRFGLNREDLHFISSYFTKGQR